MLKYVISVKIEKFPPKILSLGYELDSNNRTKKTDRNSPGFHQQRPSGSRPVICRRGRLWRDSFGFSLCAGAF